MKVTIDKAELIFTLSRDENIKSECLFCLE